MTAIRSTPRQRGFALLIVLWSMSLLALIGTQITAAGHGETRLASNLRAAAVAEAAADAAVFETVWHLLDGSPAHWQADGPPRRVRLPEAVAEVAITDEGRKLTLNNSTLPLLRGLLHALGVDPGTAAGLADRIADWRSPAEFPLRLGAKAPQYRAAGRSYGPPNAPFQSVDELALVLGMTPEVFARLRPYVTTYVESSPKAEDATGVIAQALTEAAADGGPALAFDEPPTLTITAVATGTAGGRFTRRAVVRLNTDLANNPAQMPFVVLDWSQGEQ